MFFVKTATRLKHFYFYIFEDVVDKRTDDWFLIHSPLPGLFILFLYLLFVLYIGPKFMKNRKPFELKLALKIYNFFQVLYSIYLVSLGIEIYFRRKLINFTCTPVDQSTSPDAMFTANAFYLYFCAKFTELLDTVFFVLRKKNNQVTFLHVYHHTIMCMLSWGGVKYYPGGHSTFLGFINAFVHIIMYAYYFLSAFGDRFQKYLWWKRYITVLQLVQFGLVHIHFMLPLFFPCDYPNWIPLIVILPNCTFFMLLFYDFYKKTYESQSAPQKEQLIKELKNGIETKLD